MCASILRKNGIRNKSQNKVKVKNGVNLRAQTEI